MVMKNCIILLVAIFIVNIADAQLVKGEKINVDKKNFYGVEIAKNGLYNYKGGDYVSFDKGSGWGLRFFMNTSISKNPESKWSGQIGLGVLNFASLSGNFEQQTTNMSKKFQLLQLFPIDLRLIYQIKDYGTNGTRKLYVFPGFEVCPLTMFDVSSVYSSSGYHQADTDNKFGGSIGALWGIGCRTSKLDVNLTVKYEFLMSYSQDNREKYSEPTSVHYMSVGLGIGYIF
jgi:hypothetical protein